MERMTEKDKELSAVILGCYRAGKTSIINTILGSNGVVGVTGQCVKSEGYIDGKKVTLIDTPGWWQCYTLRESTKSTKLELVRSASLCPPGPHAFLLAVDVNLVVTESLFKRLVQHVELLGDTVWEHTIVVFTKWDLIRNMTIEEHIESNGGNLKMLLDKCRNRYHVFSNTNQGNDTQVTELFQKIEDMTRNNSGRIFKIDLQKLQKVQEKWEKVQTKAVARQSRVREERSTIKAYVNQLEKLRVVLLGWVMSGKSSVGNTILNQDAFSTRKRTTTCESRFGNVAGRNITVLDTAGWWKFFSSKLNPDWVKATQVRSVLERIKLPQAMLLVIPADTSFKEEQRRSIKENMAIFGEQIWRHTIVLFTWGDSLGNLTIEQHIENEGEALQWLIEKCGNRYHVVDNTKRDDRAQVTELFEKIEEMVAANSSYHFDIPDVSEIQELQSELPLDKCDDELIEEAMHFLKLEWNKRGEEFKENVEKLIAKAFGKVKSVVQRRGSIKRPPMFSSEHESTDPAENVTGETDSKQKSSTKDDILRQLMSDLEREWGRQEAMVMEDFHEILVRWSKETRSEPIEDPIKEYLAKLQWHSQAVEGIKEHTARLRVK